MPRFAWIFRRRKLLHGSLYLPRETIATRQPLLGQVKHGRRSSALVYANSSHDVASWPLLQLLLAYTVVFDQASNARISQLQRACPWLRDTVLGAWPCALLGLPCVSVVLSLESPLCDSPCIVCDTLCCVARPLQERVSLAPFIYDQDFFFARQMNAPVFLRPILGQKLSVVCESVLFCRPLRRFEDQLRRLEANSGPASHVPELLDPHRDLDIGELEAVAALDERL